MGGRNYLGTNDGRSRRKSRSPALVRRLLHAFPREPDRGFEDGPVNAPTAAQSLGQLHRFTGHFAGYFAAVPQLEVSTGGYAQLLQELRGAESTVTLRHGCYLIHEAGPLQRVLYIGSGSDTYVRARLIWHLLPEQSLKGMAWAMGEGLPELIDSKLGWKERGDNDVDRALRRMLFARNRWTKEQGSAQSPEEQYAIEVVSNGAFDVTFIFVSDELSFLACYVEDFLVRHAQELTGERPPLNAIEVRLDRRHRERAAQFGIPANYSAASIP